MNVTNTRPIPLKNHRAAVCQNLGDLQSQFIRSARRRHFPDDPCPGQDARDRRLAEQVAKVIDIAQQFLLYARASASLARCAINYNTLPTAPALASTGL